MAFEEEIEALSNTDEVDIVNIFQLTFYDKEKQICKCFTFDDEVYKLIKERLPKGLAPRLDEVITDVNAYLWKQSALFAMQKEESEPVLWISGTRKIVP